MITGAGYESLVKVLQMKRKKRDCGRPTTKSQKCESIMDRGKESERESSRNGLLSIGGVVEAKKRI